MDVIGLNCRKNMTFWKLIKKCALGTIKLAWRGFNCRFNKTHFYAYADDATRMVKRTKFVSESVFMEILAY